MNATVTQGIFGFAGFASLLLLTVCGILTLAVAVRSVHSARIGIPVALSVFTSTSLLIVNTAFQPFLSNDQATWHQLGVAAADYLTGASGQSVDYVAGKEGYIWLLGGIYAIAGKVPLVPIALNMLLHALLVITVAKTSVEVSDSFQVSAKVKARSVRAAAFATAMLPSIVIWVPLLLRESFTMFAISASTLCVIRYSRSRRFGYLIAAFPLLLSLYWVRDSLALAVLFALCVGGVFIALRASKYSVLLRIALIAAAVIAFPRLLAILDSTIGVNAESVTATTAELSSIADSGFSGLGYNATLFEVLATTGPRVLFGPFPWEFELTGVMLLAFVEGAIWIVVLVMAARAVLVGRKSRRVEDSAFDDLTVSPILLIVAAIVLLSLMLSVGNYGILARFRPSALVLIIPIASVSYGMWRERSLTGSGTHAEERKRVGASLSGGVK